MTKRFLAAMLACGAATIGQASTLTAQSETASQTSTASMLQWDDVHGVIWGNRSLSTYVVSVHTMPASAVAGAAATADPVAQAMSTMAAGGYQTYSVATATSAANQISSTLDLNNPYDATGGVESPWVHLPGALLADMNPTPYAQTSGLDVPLLPYVYSVAPFDDSPPGVMIVPLMGEGSPDDTMIVLLTGTTNTTVPPAVVLASSNSKSSPVPTLSSTQLAAAGINPDVFAGAPAVSTVQTTTVVQAAVSPAPASSTSSSSTSTSTTSNKTSDPTTLASTSSSGTVVTSTVQSISSIAAETITTGSSSTNLATAFIASSNGTTLRAQTINPLAVSESPEPATSAMAIAGALFAAGAAAFRRRQRN